MWIKFENKGKNHEQGINMDNVTDYVIDSGFIAFTFNFSNDETVGNQVIIRKDNDPELYESIKCYLTTFEAYRIC